VNGVPLDPATTNEHVNELRTQVAPNLFAHFDLDHFPHTSLPALALAAAAYRKGDHAGEAVSLALRDALFEKGQDISHPGVLARIAEEYRVASSSEDLDAVVAEWHQGQSRGVKGSPHFICASAEAFCPSLDISKDHDGHLRMRRNTQALDQFLQVCFPLAK
jgi:predicted DsbA family dithiol-disulfide isomerase